MLVEGVDVPRRRAMLAVGFAAAVARRRAEAQPAAPAPPDARAVIAQLRLARGMLCPRCRDDIERSGVNHPARRSIFGGGALETARDMIAAAPELPGRLPALRQVLYAIEVLRGQDEEEGAWAIDAAILAIEAEGRVAARRASPDPRALMGQLQLVRRFLCPRCLDSAWLQAGRARATEELGVAQAMLAATPRLRHAEAVGARLTTAVQALAATDDRRADAALAWAIERLRPR
jgi:hypothetical protein